MLSGRTYLGVFVMICIILGVLLHIANYFINSGKPKTSKKPLLWLAGTFVVLFAMICVVLYILAPIILNSFGIRGEDPCVSNQPPVPPYCGEYCHDSSAAKSSENCTCLMD
jgi:hypothetical protein